MLITMALSLSACALKTQKKPVEKTKFTLGTIVSIKAYGDGASEAIDKALDRISHIEKKMTTKVGLSEVSKINNCAGNDKYYKASSDTFYVIQKGKYYSELSKGRFNIAIGPLVNLWGIGTDNPQVPSRTEIDRVLDLINYKDIDLNKGQKGVRLTKPGMALDLGGIAKGYAADEVVRILKKHHIKSAIIDLGGNLYALGSNPNGSLWKLGLQDPFDIRGSYFATMEVKDKTLVTSGPYERYFEKDKKRYHHILDTSTGFPVENNLVSVTIVSNSSIDADALSTAVFSLGLKDGMALIEQVENTEAVLVTDDYHVYTTSGIGQYKFEITKNQFKLKKPKR